VQKFLLFICCVVLFITLNGCARLEKFTRPFSKADEAAAALALPVYSGPKARVIVADFEVKVAKATNDIGLGLREIFITALVNSNRFEILEPQAQVVSFQEKRAAPAEKTGIQISPKEEEKKADLIIALTVNEFEPQVSGGKGGLGGGGGVGSGILGGLSGSASNKACMIFDVRIVNSATSQVLAATQVKGEASDITIGEMPDLFGEYSLAGGLSAYSDSPMEKAIRICIIEAVRYVSQAISPEYYKY